MAETKDLWGWFCSLNEIEKPAIATWILNGDPGLIFTFAASSEVLQKLSFLISREASFEEFL